MRTVNVDSGRSWLLGDFWEQRYLPFLKVNMKASTVTGYQQIWNRHLKDRFGQMTLQSYRTHVGSTLLLGLESDP